MILFNKYSTLSGDKYEVVDGGVSQIVPVPSDDFILSFRSSNSEIFIFLLANNDIMKSDMIMMIMSSNIHVGICQENAGTENQMLPNKKYRKCSSGRLFHNEVSVQYLCQRYQKGFKCK
jgi:hypothetical protein